MRRSLTVLFVLIFGAHLLAGQNYSYGVVTSNLESNHAAKAVALGTGYVRLNFLWSDIEASNDNFDWSGIDSFVDNAVNNDLKIYATLGGTPSWAKVSWLCGGDHCMPNLTAWQDFVEEAIDRYDYLGSDIVFGIWNEPDGSQFLSPSTPEAYRDIFLTADAARDSINSSAILGISDMGSGGYGNGWFSDVWNYIDQDVNSQDIVAVHWYYHDAIDLYDLIDGVSNITGGRETWLTETGYGGDNDSDQASHVVAIVQAFNSRYQSNWTKMFLYFLQGNGINENIVRSDWTNRPGFYAYRNNIPGLGAYPPPDDSDSLGPNEYLLENDSVCSYDNEYCLVYQGDGNLVMYHGSTAVWASDTDGESVGMAVMQSDGNFVVYNASNNAVWASGTDGNNGAYFIVRPDGVGVIYRSDGYPIGGLF